MYDIQKRKFQNFKEISKSIMATQKRKKILFEFFGVFERQLTQNPSNQDLQFSWFIQTIWKTVRKSKNMGLQGITSFGEWFQNLLLNKFSKMTEKLNFMVFRALFLIEVHIQQRWYLTGRNSFWSVIRRKKTEQFTIIRKSIMAAQKCKNVWL